jgi:soluble lytic murein transglycosylase
MLPRSLIIAVVALATVAVPLVPGVSNDVRAQAAAPTVVTAADPQLARVRLAIEAAERGQFDASQYADLTRHPLYGWVEYAGLRRNIDTLSNSQAQAFLARYAGQAVAEVFREIWLAAAARREDWPAFLAAWKPLPSNNLGKSNELRCAELNARQALGRADAQWVADAQALWRSTGKALPNTCDAPINVLAAKGGLTPELRWERIENAAAEWQPAVMRNAARGLSTADAALANDYAAFFEAVHERALRWPKTERSRHIASHGLARLAKSVPLAGEAQLPKYAQALGFSDAERGRVLYQAALDGRLVRTRIRTPPQRGARYQL